MKKTISVVAVIIAMSFSALTVFGQEPNADTLFLRWQEASLMRLQEQYVESEEILRNIILDYQDADSIEQRAWCEILFTKIESGNQEQQFAVAREALLIFPDLKADEVYIPQNVNTLLNSVRSQMYGSLVIREPEGAQVFLDDTSMGIIPVDLPYVLAGEHRLRVILKDHDDYDEAFIVDPEGQHLFENISLNRQKDAWYWISRVGGGAVAVGSIFYFASSDDPVDGPAALPGAPDPPQ